MFVQVIKGRVADPARVKAALDRWAEELAPGAEGWLGTTAGVTEDGRFVAEVDVDTNGDPATSTFVQVMQGRTSDPERARRMMAEDSTDWSAFRPDMLGSVAAGHDGGAYTMVMWFTSEAEAREGERKEPPPELKAQMEEMGTLSVGETEFFDLKDPWMYAPR
jgi:hypothetical protein